MLKPVPGHIPPDPWLHPLGVVTIIVPFKAIAILGCAADALCLNTVIVTSLTAPLATARVVQRLPESPPAAERVTGPIPHDALTKTPMCQVLLHGSGCGKKRLMASQSLPRHAGGAQCRPSHEAVIAMNRIAFLLHLRTTARSDERQGGVRAPLAYG